MKRFPTFALAVFVAVSVPLIGEDLRLIPYPQSVIPTAGGFTLNSPAVIGLASQTPADRFAAGLLAEDLRQVARIDASVGAPSQRTAILIGRPGTASVDAQIARRKLDTSYLEKAESYLLSVDSSGVLLAANSDEGIFYGVQTLRQLLRPSNAKARIPQVLIMDWPALRYRGLSVDVSQGPVPTDEQLYSIIRTCAEYKLNLVSLYMEHVFPYRHTPMVAPPGGEITPELMKRLVEYAQLYHIDIVPQQQTFGHLHHLLKLERYTDMAEVPHGQVLAARDERGYEWTRNVAEQLAACTRSKFLHIGSDETWELGQGRSRAYTESMGIGNVYMEHMRKVADMLRPMNRRLMFWGDIALKYPDQVSSLPKDMIAMTWHYEPKADFSNYIIPFKEAGLEFFVCPGLNDWYRIFPNLTKAISNINNFVRDGKKHGALGMFSTDWKNRGETLFNMAWYGIVFSAAAAWQHGTVDVEAFDRAFDWAYFRSDGETFAKAIRQLDQIYGLFRSIGADDWDIEWVWFDPFSRPGVKQVRKALPIASEIRKLAEGAWIEITLHSADARVRRDQLNLLRFAAKRFDYVGMKIQASQAMADAYRRKEPDRGTLQASDLRDYIHELKQAYRSLWMSENREYWLDNVLIRYDNEALYWVQKGQLFAAARREFRSDKVLPTPESLGLILP